MPASEVYNKNKQIVLLISRLIYLASIRGNVLSLSHILLRLWCYGDFVLRFNIVSLKTFDFFFFVKGKCVRFCQRFLSFLVLTMFDLGAEKSSMTFLLSTFFVTITNANFVINIKEIKQVGLKAFA